MRCAVKERTVYQHIGFGKVILFGEHFVVYGAEAIVAGIVEYTSCELELQRGVPGVRVVDKRPAVRGYIAAKAAEQKEAHQLVLKHLRIDTTTDGLRVHLAGPLVPSSGIGASASDVVSLSRALNELYGLDLNNAAVNEAAFAGECGYHGTPSGVDNTAATYGGLISYRRSGGKATFSRLSLKNNLYLVVCGTGITASTTEVVKDVARRKAEDPGWFNALLQRYNACVSAAREAMLQGDLQRVGALMNENHTLCQQLTVSCAELDTIVDYCRKKGALGAKMSGTGRGGLVVALAADEAQRNCIAEDLEKNCSAAKYVWKYSVLPMGSKL